MHGPYRTEQETRAEPMPTAVGMLYQTGQVQPGDPQQVVRGTVLRYLQDACRRAGVELGAYDREALSTLAGTDETVCQVVIGMLARAHAAGQATPATSSAAAAGTS